MGCSSSAPRASAPQKGPAATSTPASVAPPAGKGNGKGKSQGKGKGKGKARNFQIELSNKWEDYGKEEDVILKRTYLVGQPNAKFSLRGQHYEYSFVKMVQKNLGTGKERKIRPPPTMSRPKDPLLPPGSIVVIAVPEGGKTSMDIPDPNNPGRTIQVAVPPNARPGSQMAVPVPEKGENIEGVVQRQRGWSKGAKVASGAAAVGALAVGGVVLGEHLSGGAISAWAEATPEVAAAGDWVTSAAGDVADWTTGAVEDAGEWATGATADVGDWTAGAAAEAGDWAADAVDDAGDWAVGAADDVGEWLGDLGEDAGGFVMSLF